MTLYAPTLDDFATLAEAAIKTIPDVLRQHTGDIHFRIEDFPSDEVIRDMELQTEFDLLGLYHGVPLTEQSLADAAGRIDVVTLYRRPILDYWCETGEELTHLIRHVMIHEIGHHFGFSDEAMHALEEAAGT